MKKIFLPLLVACSMVTACRVPPQEYFSTAALNCNLLFGFAAAGMQSELASPSVKLVDTKTNETAPMKRVEVVQNKLDQVSANLEKVQGLAMEEDSEEMIKASIALYEFTLPIYKNEYMALAAMYDNNEPSEKIARQEKLISDKYSAKFGELYNAVMTHGTAYAAKHGIPVQTVNPAPPTVPN